MPEPINLDNLLSGIIPETLEGKTAAAGQLVRIARRIVPVTSLLIASARRDHFAGAVAAWADWCHETFDIDGADRDHRRVIGDLLLAFYDDKAFFAQLFHLPYNKLLALTRIPADQLKAFASHLGGNIDKMTREELRDAVKLWIGEAVQEPKNTDGGLHSSEEPEFSTIVHSILKMQQASLLSEVRDDASAALLLNGGFRLLGSALEFKKHEDVPDVAFLSSVKAALLDEVSEIEAAISRAAQV